MVKFFLQIKFIYIIILSIIIISKQDDEEELKLDIFRDKNVLNTGLVFGNPPQMFMLTLDLGAFHVWVGNKTIAKKVHRAYNIKRSKTVDITDNIDIIAVNQKGNEVCDIVRFGPPDRVIQTDKKFSFLLVNKLEPVLQNDGVLGLARSYPGKIMLNKRTIEANPRFSLIEYLYNNQLINNKGFTIKFDDSIHGEITLGEDTVDNQVAYCSPNNKIINDGNFYKWNCEYSGILVDGGKKIFEFSNDSLETVLFDSISDDISIYQDYAYTLYTILNDTLENKCERINSEYGGILFCKNINLNDVPNFYIKFPEFDFKISNKELFEEYIDETRGHSISGYLSKIRPSKTKGFLKLGFNYWRYYEMYFNMEDGKIEFSEFNEEFKMFAGPRGPFRRRFRRQRGFWEGIRWYHITIMILGLSFICFVIYYFIKRKQLKKKFIGKPNIITTNEKLIDPIGTPMLNKL